MKGKLQKNLADPDYRFALFMIAPAVILVGLLVIYPMCVGIKLSMFKYNLMSKNRPFIGLKNYITLLKDPETLQILWNTIYYAFTANIISTILGLAIALLLNKSGPLTGSLRAIGYIPWITPGVVYIFVWSWMFSKSFGPINTLLLNWGLINSPISFLGDASKYISGLPAPVFSVLLVRIWSSFAFKMVMFLAALQNIPKEQYEAAKIDGANLWKQFCHVIIPSIIPVFLVVFSISMIWNLSHFEVNYLLTNGGPKNLTNVLTIFIYNKAFIHYDMGESSAAGMIIFVLAGVIGFIYMMINRRVEKNDN